MSLKNSLFVALFCWLGSFFAGIYKRSFVSRIIDSVYGFFSKKWSESSIVRFVSVDSDDAVSKSAILSFFSGVGRFYLAFGKKIRGILQESVFCKLLLSFVDSILAVNTRFFGVLFCSVSVGYSICLITGGGQVSLYGVAVLALGAVLSLFNKNLYNLFASSFVASSLFGFFCVKPGEKKQPSINVYSIVAAVVTGLVSGVLLYKSLILCLAALVGICFAAVIVRYPVVGAFCAVFIAPFVPTMVLVAAVIFVFGVYLVHAVCSGKAIGKLKSINIALAIFVFINIVSAFVSFSVINSLQVIAVSFSMMLIYIVICGTVTDKSKLLAILKVFVISGVAVALYGICQYLFGWGLDVKNAWIDEDMFEQATVRVYSTLENPNVLGEYLLLVAFPALALAFHSEKWYSKLFYMASLAVLVVCLILTQSRGCWIGFILGIAVYVTFTKGKLWALLPLVLVAMPLVLPQTIIDRFGSIGDLGDTSSSYRMFIWLGTFQMLKDYWFFGVGQGQQAFNMVYPSYSYSLIIAPHAHNLYLQIFAECGIAGLISFLAICVFWFKKLVSVFRKTERGLFKVLPLVLGAGMLAYLVQGMFDYVFYNYRVIMIFWSVMGMGMALYNVTEVSDD